MLLVLPLSSCCLIQNIIKTVIGSIKTSNTAAGTSETSLVSTDSTGLSDSPGGAFV
ncbi:MAG: hypothetical protein ACYCXB_01835 [Candidatus Humimicrobiaceae bacterium]